MGPSSALSVPSAAVVSDCVVSNSWGIGRTDAPRFLLVVASCSVAVDLIFDAVLH